MDREIRLGIVGCGGISHAHAQAARQSALDVRFVACCDIDEVRARAWAEKYGCDVAYADFEEMLRSENLDGVYVATWPVQHREQIERCIHAGARNILCQKALTLTGQEAVEIWRMVNDVGAFLMEGFMYRHHPAMRRIEKLLIGGGLGAVDYVRAVFNAYDPESASPGDQNRDWRMRKECGGGVPYDFACYAVNACGHFCDGIPVRVSASGSEGRYGTINRLFGLITYDNGREGIVESSKKTSYNQELQIGCSQGVLNYPTAWVDYPDMPCPQISVNHSSPAGWLHLLEDVYSLPKADPYQCELENFVSVICGMSQPGMPLLESVINTFVIEALVTSVSKGCAVEIDIPDDVIAAFRASKGGMV